MKEDNNLARYVIILLCSFFIIVGLYHDLSLDAMSANLETADTLPNIDPNTDFTVESVQVRPGDTLLSIIEELNHPKLLIVDMEKFITDFQQVNEKVDANQLQAHAYYYFPVYKKMETE